MIICDTGPLVAVLNETDDEHRRFLDLLERHPGPLLIPSPVLTEVCYFLESRVGPHAESAFLRAVLDGEFKLIELTRADLARMAELVECYADFPLGAVDASVIAVAERLKVSQVAMLDQKHFSVVRPSHCGALTLLP